MRKEYNKPEFEKGESFDGATRKSYPILFVCGWIAFFFNQHVEATDGNTKEETIWSKSLTKWQDRLVIAATKPSRSARMTFGTIFYPLKLRWLIIKKWFERKFSKDRD